MSVSIPEKKRPAICAVSARLADIYVNDAFGTAHRAHASTEGVARYLPAVAGFLMEKELEALSWRFSAPGRPFVAILGDKVSDKIDVIRSLLTRVDYILVGGGMANTFLKALGNGMGKSLVEEEKLEEARAILHKAAETGVDLILPADVVAGDRFSADAQWITVTPDSIPEDWMALDIGPAAVRSFSEIIKKARTIFWNGPLGVYEFDKFAVGTNKIAQVLTTAKPKRLSAAAMLWLP